MKTAKVLSNFMATTVSTCFKAWKLHHRILKEAAAVIQAQENTALLERYEIMCASLYFTDRACAGGRSEYFKRFHIV